MCLATLLEVSAMLCCWSISLCQGRKLIIISNKKSPSRGGNLKRNEKLSIIHVSCVLSCFFFYHFLAFFLDLSHVFCFLANLFLINSHLYPKRITCSPSLPQESIQGGFLCITCLHKDQSRGPHLIAKFPSRE